MYQSTAKVQSIALLIHQVEQSATNEQAIAIMAHDVFHQENGQSMLGAGRPFGHTEKKHMLDILSQDTSPEMEFLEARCLAQGKETLMWYRPRQRTQVDVLGKDYNVPLPSLVFLLHQKELFVAAYAGDKRPTKDTRLLKAGLPNVGGIDGLWCSGGNSLPSHPRQSHIEEVERVFFLSPFTHFNGADAEFDLPGAEDSTTKEYMLSYFDLLASKRTFPVSKLARLEGQSTHFRRNFDERGVTLKSWFDAITGH